MLPLCVPAGNVLLLGVGGSGRQSLTRLACFMEGYDVFSIEIAKGYGANEWREDLRRLLRRAGCEGRDVVFLLSDTQIIQVSGGGRDKACMWLARVATPGTVHLVPCCETTASHLPEAGAWLLLPSSPLPPTTVFLTVTSSYCEWESWWQVHNAAMQ